MEVLDKEILITKRPDGNYLFTTTTTQKQKRTSSYALETRVTSQIEKEQITYTTTKKDIITPGKLQAIIEENTNQKNKLQEQINEINTFLDKNQDTIQQLQSDLIKEEAE